MEDVGRIYETFSEFARDDVEWPSSFVLRDDAGRKIDCHPLRFDENGDGWQANAAGGAPYRWPRDGLAGLGRIGGVAVPCITPELQLRWHVYPEFDDFDWRDVTRLAKRFDLDVPPQLRDRPGFVAKKRGATMG
jgi:lincosamide nucleotidyltransferase A/C/D/E